MASDDKTRDDADSATSASACANCGKQTRRANCASRTRRSRRRTSKRGFDPYNTSGSFDRKKNWTRVGKR